MMSFKGKCAVKGVTLFVLLSALVCWRLYEDYACYDREELRDDLARAGDLIDCAEYDRAEALLERIKDRIGYEDREECSATYSYSVPRAVRAMDN